MAGLDHPRSLNRDSWLLCHLAVARHHAIFEAGRPLHWSAEAGVTGYMIVEAAVGFHCAFLTSAIGFLKRGRPRHWTTAAGSPASE